MLMSEQFEEVSVEREAAIQGGDPEVIKTFESKTPTL